MTGIVSYLCMLAGFLLPIKIMNINKWSHTESSKESENNDPKTESLTWEEREKEKLRPGAGMTVQLQEH